MYTLCIVCVNFPHNVVGICESLFHSVHRNPSALLFVHSCDLCCTFWVQNEVISLLFQRRCISFPVVVILVFEV